MQQNSHVHSQFHYSSTNFTSISSQKYQTRQLIPLNQMQVRQGVKQLHFCEKQQICVLLTNDCILIVNSIYRNVTKIIKKLQYPRFVRLAKNGKFIVAYYSNNTVSIMDLNGKQISNVLGVPMSSHVFLISDNCLKLLYGNNQTICMWDIQKAAIDVLTKQWKNINCYAISQDGNQFALGTYSGSIFVLTIVGEQRVTQFQIQRHKSCVMCLIFNKKNLASVSYDKVYIETTVESNERGQKLLTYSQHSLNQVPRQLISCGDKVYMMNISGLFWLSHGKQLGFSTEGTWNVFQNQDGITIFTKYDRAQIYWYKFEQVKPKLRPNLFYDALALAMSNSLTSNKK